ncbi:hypothetical protein ACFPOE_13305 [Caenimonas terrae]|uniref:Uncharacterized protein n=1 Tax=Caenimonas terrae TaxID=696074 RepID=A0ABW0NGU3_9BURK
MCYLVHQHQADMESGIAAPARNPERLRPRTAAALGAALIGGLALAAISVAPATPPGSIEKSAVTAGLTSKASLVPTAGVVEVGPGLADDGVPAATDVANAGAGHCHHGM